MYKCTQSVCTARIQYTCPAAQCKLVLQNGHLIEAIFNFTLNELITKVGNQCAFLWQDSSTCAIHSTLIINKEINASHWVYSY